MRAEIWICERCMLLGEEEGLDHKSQAAQNGAIDQAHNGPAQAKGCSKTVHRLGGIRNVSGCRLLPR